MRLWEGPNDNEKTPLTELYYINYLFLFSLLTPLKTIPVMKNKYSVIIKYHIKCLGYSF